jgi:hypothetical protein
MAHVPIQEGPISRLATETLTEIFTLCLPSFHPAETRFHSTFFIKPSRSEAPLLLCQISSQWRTIAKGLNCLWTSLNTENVLHSELVEIWLQRAKQSPLSLRISQPLIQFPEYNEPVQDPVILPSNNYQFPIHLHLPLLLPKLSQCRHLETVGWHSPQFIRPQFDSPLQLESVSVVVDENHHRAALWFAALMSQAPRLAKLHWNGPTIAAPWSQLTHLSWAPADPIHFEETLEKLPNLTHLRLNLHWSHRLDFAAPEVSHVMPQVTTFFFCGEGAILPFLTLPRLQKLIVQSTRSGPVGDNAQDLRRFLQRSQCAISTLEIDLCSWFTPLTMDLSIHTPSVLNHASIHNSLISLVISSRDLTNFFSAFNKSTPGTLPPKLRVLTSAHRCFRIDTLPGIAPDETKGVLAAIIRAGFPVLAHLDLDVQGYFVDELEARNVTTGSTSFILRRPTAVRIEYESWWNSADGDQFRIALATGKYVDLIQWYSQWPGKNIMRNPWQRGFM